MPSIDIIALSSVAAVNSSTDGANIRVYQQADDGGVREAIFQRGWSGGQKNNTVGVAKSGSALAALQIGDLSQIRVFGIGTDDAIVEMAHDAGGSWVVGAMTGRFRVASDSGLAAISLGGGAFRVRVFAQKTNGTIQEYCNDGNSSGWFEGSNLGAALPGTSIAAIVGAAQGRESIRVYFQDTSRTVVEKAHEANGDWHAGQLRIPSQPAGVSLAAVAWGAVKGIRVFYGAGGRVREKAWNAQGSTWFDGAFDQSSIDGSRIAAIDVNKDGDLRVYLQAGNDGTAFTEFGVTSSGGWKVSYRALPPA